jgi:hypothetical protein
VQQKKADAIAVASAYNQLAPGYSRVALYLVIRFAKPRASPRLPEIILTS